jgi:hypothetical protein
MRVRPAVAALAGLVALGACSQAPSCTYSAHPNFPARELDPSQASMLPYNPYWVFADPTLPVIGSPGNPCAGQPGYPGRLPS